MEPDDLDFAGGGRPRAAHGAVLTQGARSASEVRMIDRKEARVSLATSGIGCRRNRDPAV
jgi:hypothetical protein